MSYIDPITDERVTVPARTIPTRDQFCAVCSVRLDHDRDDLAFGPDARYVHARGCRDIAWGDSDAVACDGGCGTLLADGDGETCTTCETDGPICSWCGRHHFGGPNEMLDADTYRDEDCRIRTRIGWQDRD